MRGGRTTGWAFPRPLPRVVARPFTALVLLSWPLAMGFLIRQAYFTESVALAADLSRYGRTAQWNGVYYRGEKIGFTVSQVEPNESGYTMIEDGQLTMNVLGVSTSIRLTSRVRVDRAFCLRDLTFGLDPGRGPTTVSGALDGTLLHLTIKTSAGERSEDRPLPAPPALALNLPRILAAKGLKEGRRFTVQVFDPATMRNAPMEVAVQGREVIQAAGRPVPVFRVQNTFSGIVTKAWITDSGDVVREESPLGLLTQRETPEQAQSQAISASVQSDLLESAAIVPGPPDKRIDVPAAVLRLRLRLTGADGFPTDDLQGAGQRVEGNVFDIEDATRIQPTALDQEATRSSVPEPFIESDAPQILAEARKAVGDARGPRAQAERLVRHVHALLEKRPTVGIPSALEVLRTRVGDCNEHSTLYVALARSIGIPARIAVGLVSLHGAFYYHAWVEVYLAEQGGGLWMPVDPTLNQFPADATHIRLTRGGLDRQAAILGLVGRAQIEILDLEVEPGVTPTLVGASTDRSPSFDLPLPVPGNGRRCWSSPSR